MSGKKQENVKLAAVTSTDVGARERQNRFSARFSNVQDKARLKLVDLLAHMFDQADDALFEMADRAASNHDQNIYFESMRELRIRRRGMEMEFVQRFDAAFLALGSHDSGPQGEDIDIMSLALVHDNEIEEMLAIEGMVARAMFDCAEELSLLSMRFDSLVDSVRIVNANNPIAPQPVCEIFAATCGSLDVDIKARLVVLKLFEKFVAREFVKLYQTLNRDLAEDGVLTNISLADNVRRRRRPVNRASGPQHQAGQARYDAGYNEPRDSNRFEDDDNGGHHQGSVSNSDAMFFQLQSLLQHAGHIVGGRDQGPVGGAGHPVGGGHRTEALPAKTVRRVEVLDLLSSLQSFQPGAPVDAFGYVAEVPQQRELRQLIADKLNQDQDGTYHTLGEVDEDAIKLVSLLFQFVLEDDNLAGPLKSLLSLLQVPMAKVALIDKSFFGKNSHPARKLLNIMAHAGIGWSPSGNADRDFLYRKFKQAVETVLSSFDDDIGVFETVLSDFLSFMENERRRAGIVEQRTLETEQGKARAELAQAIVVKTVTASMAGKTLPTALGELLNHGWSKVLFLIYAREGEDSGSWKSACRVMDELIWSVQPKTTETERERLQTLTPGLFNSIRSGLARVGFSHFAMNHFLDQLNDIYDRLLQPDAPESVAEPVENQVEAAKPVASFSAPPANSGTTLDDMLSKSRVHPTGAIPPVSETGTAAEPVAPGAANNEDLLEGFDPAMLSAVDKLSTGSWVQFKQSEATSFRCRLAAVLKPSGKYIFVNRAGKKVAEWTREQLAANVAKDIVMLLDDRQLFDRALESVISQLQHSRHSPE